MDDAAVLAQVVVLLETLGKEVLGATSWQNADVGGGRIDLFWQFGKDDVNVAGAALVAREAGAIVTDAAGNTWMVGASSILVAGPTIHAHAVTPLRALVAR